MSRMSEQHDDLSIIHAILLGQRKVAQNIHGDANPGSLNDQYYSGRIDAINDLLLEIEAEGVVWPDNVVDISHG